MNYFALFLTSTLMCLTLSGCWSQASFKDKTGRRLSHLDLNSFKLEEESIDGEVSTFRYNDGEKILAVREVPFTDSSKFIADREFLVESLFKTRQMPYPGAITTQSECGNDQKPQKLRVDSADVSVLGFELWANSRHMYGQCMPEQQVFKSFYAIVTCPRTQRGYEVKLFVPAKVGLPALRNFISGFKCET